MWWQVRVPARGGLDPADQGQHWYLPQGGRNWPRSCRGTGCRVHHGPQALTLGLLPKLPSQSPASVTCPDSGSAGAGEGPAPATLQGSCSRDAALPTYVPEFPPTGQPLRQRAMSRGAVRPARKPTRPPPLLRLPCVALYPELPADQPDTHSLDRAGSLLSQSSQQRGFQQPEHCLKTITKFSVKV